MHYSHTQLLNIILYVTQLHGKNITYLLPPVCVKTDLLLCTELISLGSNTLCCAGNSVCVEYSGLSIGDVATYNTSNEYCIDTELVRMCNESNAWEGTIPAVYRGKKMH